MTLLHREIKLFYFQIKKSLKNMEKNKFLRKKIDMKNVKIRI